MQCKQGELYKCLIREKKQSFTVNFKVLKMKGSFFAAFWTYTCFSSVLFWPGWGRTWKNTQTATLTLVCCSGEQWRRNLVRVGLLRAGGEGLADRQTLECWALNGDNFQTHFLLTVTTSKMGSSADCWIWVWFVPFSENWRKLLTRFINLIETKRWDVVYLGKLKLTKFATDLISYSKTGWENLTAN